MPWTVWRPSSGECTGASPSRGGGGPGPFLAAPSSSLLDPPPPLRFGLRADELAAFLGEPKRVFFVPFALDDHGAYAAKAVVGEHVPIRATVFREGHDAVNASVILTDPDGVETRHDMTPLEPRGLDPWEAWVRFDREGAWTFRVEGWSDPWGTWLHNAEAKLAVGIDVELVCLEGRDLLERSAQVADAANDPIQASILRATAQLLIPQRPAEDILDVATGSGLAKAMSGELVEFDTSKGPVMGQVMNLELDTVGCVIYGDALAVQEGDTVKATTRLLEVPAGHACWVVWWIRWAPRLMVDPPSKATPK